MRLHGFILVLLIPSILWSCDGQKDENVGNKTNSSDTVQGKLLATIDDREIHEQELQSLLVDMFGEYRASTMDEASRKRALQSLISSYALAKKATTELTAINLSEIDMKAMRYRQNLLINGYMKTKIDPASLSHAHIKKYYEKNLSKFGMATVKQYQILTTQNKLPEELRDKYMSLVSSNRKSGGLENINAALKQQGFDVQLQTANLNKELLDERLYQFINAQKLNTLSELTFINGKSYLIKIVAEKVLPAKPLAEVSDLIRKSLLLEQLRDAIKIQSESVLAESNVVYIE